MGSQPHTRRLSNLGTALSPVPIPWGDLSKTAEDDYLPTCGEPRSTLLFAGMELGLRPFSSKAVSE